MTRFALLVTALVLFAIMAIVTPAPIAAQEHTSEGEEHASEEPEFHRNHFGGFLGASRHSDVKESAPTLGLEYARVFSRHWAAVGYVEMVGGELERDFILILGAIFYPIRQMGIVLGPGIERASTSVEHGGEVEEESEYELIIRGGVAYGFKVAEVASLAPTVFVDWTDVRWTLVYGLGFVVGF